MAEIFVSELGADGGLFHLPVDALCPRVGEILLYQFAVWDGDKPQWADDSWAHGKAMDGKAWKVVRVEHHIRRNSLTSTNGYTWVYVRRIPTK